MRLLSLTVPLLLLPLAYAATGGPDGGEMVFTDSADAEGPAHAWLDASEGAAYALGDDATVTVPLPFPFSFYGAERSEVTISSNGALFFAGATPSPVGICPGASTAWTGIAAYWDDLAAGTVHTRTFGVYPWRTFVVSWDNAVHADVPGSTGRFQVWLLEGRNEAVVVLDDTTWGDAAHDDGATATIGTNGPSDGLAWSCDTTFAPGTTAWFGRQGDRPDRARIDTDDIAPPWTGRESFEYAGRSVATGDVNGDGTDDLLIGIQDRDVGEVALAYRPDVPDTLAAADATFRGKLDGDAYGAAVLLSDLDGDGRDEVVVGAPGNDDAANRAGAVYTWAGGSWTGVNMAADAASTWTGPSATAGAGTTLAAGDVDGDGYVDLIVGAPTADTASTDAGAFYVVYGTATAPAGTGALAVAGASFLGSHAADQLGGAVAAGDLDGDGAAEILASALFADDGAADSGAVYVVPGGVYAGSHDIATAAACALAGGGTSARFGAALLATDLDGSGLFDLAVGAPTADSAYADAGSAYVFYDPADACPTVAGATISGARASAQLGSTLTAGDLDGDGVDDLVIGAPNMTLAASGGGAAYVFTSPPVGSVGAADAAHVLAGSGGAAALGTALAVAGNPGDVPTLVATAPYDSVAYASEGAIYQWTWRADFTDLDGDGFVGVTAGGNDCDDAEELAFPDGWDEAGDSVDGDCDGWIDGEVRVRSDADAFAWDLADVGGGTTDTYGFETYAEGDDIGHYGDVALAGDIVATSRVYGAAADGTRAARVIAVGTNTVGIAFAEPIDALSLRVLDPDDDFTLEATGPGGTVVTGYTFALAGEDRTGGLFRGFTFADEVTAVTLTGASSDGFGIDTLEVAWSADSDRDADGFSDAAGDCDDTDDAVYPGAPEDLANGVDDDCDGIIDAGDATAYTDAADWAAAAALDATTVIDFEDRVVSEVIEAQYVDVGALFDGGLTAAGTIDGTAPNGTRAARATGDATTVLFDEDQHALGFYVLDGDTTFTVQAYQNGVLHYTRLFTPSSERAFFGLVFDLAVDEIVVSGADVWGLDDVTFASLGLDDADGDGLTERDGDCDDDDASAWPGAPETWYDGVDADCAGDDDFDADADGASWTVDCDDEDATAHPGAEEIWYDGVDTDCDGLSDYDADRDGHDDPAFGGDDCDDTDGDVNPDAVETWYDGVDQDCAGDDDYDADGDGHAIDGSVGGTDCDDDDRTISPDAEEIWYDGVDQDCSGAGTSDFDADDDGYEAEAWGGVDCEDGEPTAYPGAPGEACYDGIDQDCDGADDYDCDGDGYASDDWGGDDCDDADVDVSPAAADAMGDGIDTNCDGGPEFDFDGDGFDGVAEGGRDCDDTDETISPAADDACYDGLDQDCDGWDDADCDRDGYASDLFGGDDCDDAVGGIHPGATDFPYDGVDSDCAADADFDIDADGHTSVWYGGDDCDDRDAAAYPGAVDACYDGVDADCGGDDDDDCDGDGVPAAGAGGADCDDGDAGVGPGAAEIVGDGIDQDCDGADATVCTDCDGDGFDGGVDCDDTDAAVFPGAADAPYDGVDADCALDGDYDADGDGADAIAWGGGDCDDADAAVSPANTVDPCGGGDEDCDGTLDEDCEAPVDTGPDDTGDTGEDTGPHDTDTAPDTRDTAADWRPEPTEMADPAYVTNEGCGCATPGVPGSGAAMGVALAGLALARRRR